MSGTCRTAARVGLALVVAASIGGALAAARQAPVAAQLRQPTFRAGVNFVRLDVIATNRSGARVSDLKAEDFEVTEQGKRQKIETFKLVSLDGGLMAAGDQAARPIRSEEDEQHEAARDDVRLFGIFLDDYHVKRDSSLGAREQIARFIDTQLGPSDMIGVMYPLSALSSILMTRNHDAVKRGVEEFVGRKYNYEPQNAIEEKYQFESCTTVEQIRNQVSLSALRAFIIHLGGLKEGRKALILVSEGYSSYLPRPLRCANAAAAASGNPNSYPAAGATANASDVEENRLRSQGVADMTVRLRDVLDDANRYNVSIYAVDPRRLATSEFGIDQPAVDTRIDEQYLNDTMETLQTLSRNTDGRAIVNRNDLTTAMKQIVVDTSAYYLLGYNSTFTTPDGKFHEINVRVKRPGIELRARKGYWAFNRSEAEAVSAPPKPGPPKAVENALNTAAIATTAHDRVVRTWLGVARGDNGRTRVTFVWEPAPRPPGDPTRSSDQPMQVALTAGGFDGSSYFRGRVPGGGGVVASAAAGGRVTFEAPPGRMELRISVQGAGAAVLDTETREVAVPNLTAPETILSTPEVFRARTAREMQQLEADAYAVPIVGRDFARADRLLIRVAAYGPGSPPRLTAKLLGRGGQAIVDLPVTQRLTPEASRQIELSLGNLASGEYIIELDATGEGGDAKELVGFRVVG